LTCYRTRRRLGAYLDGALDPETASATAAHLTSCAVCQREAGELKRLHGLLVRNLTPAAPTDWTGFFQGVVRGIEDQRVARPAPARRGWLPAVMGHRWAFGGGLVAAVLLSLGVWQYSIGVRPSEAGVLVTSAHTDDPRGTVMVYSTPEQDVAVVWVFGLND
jgi:anti-sigma factor RsiW